MRISYKHKSFPLIINSPFNYLQYFFQIFFELVQVMLLSLNYLQYFHKSSIVLLGEKGLLLAIIVNIFGCKVQGFHLKYLGIPLSPNRLRREDWTPLFEFFERKLEGWRGNLLSLEGRLTLLSSLLTATHMYYMSYFAFLSGSGMRLTESADNSCGPS